MAVSGAYRLAPVSGQGCGPMVKVGVKLVPPVGVSLRLPQRHGASAAHLARCHHLPLNAVGGLLVVFHGSALPVLRFAGGSLARDLCEIRLRQLQHRPRTDCHAGRPDTRCHATELERIETNQTRLIEERAQLQDELQEALAEADHAKSDQVRITRDVAGMFDELKALSDKHIELHVERTRLQTELEQARRP
jgi:hypothetical protein